MKILSSFLVLGIVASFLPAQGDDPCSATILPGSGNYAGDTTGAAVSGAAFNCPYSPNNASRDLWYKVNLCVPSTIELSTCSLSMSGQGSAAYDTYLAIYNGTPGCPWANSTAGMAVVACNDDEAACGAGYQSHVGPTAVLPAGTYYIRVAGYSSGDFGAYVMETAINAAGAGFAASIISDTVAQNISVNQAGGNANDNYFFAFSLDPLNLTACGTGAWFGLHIAIPDVFSQYAAGFFVGALDGAGAASVVIPIPGYTTPFGVNVSGVTIAWNAVGTFTQNTSVVSANI